MLKPLHYSASSSKVPGSGQKVRTLTHTELAANTFLVGVTVLKTSIAVT